MMDFPDAALVLIVAPSNRDEWSAPTADVPSLFPCLCSVHPATINRMPTVLLCPPHYFDVVDQKNPYMSRESAVDRVKARSQWETLCGVLQQNGCEVQTIDPVDGLEDMVFAANQVFVGE